MKGIVHHAPGRGLLVARKPLRQVPVNGQRKVDVHGRAACQRRRLPAAGGALNGQAKQKPRASRLIELPMRQLVRVFELLPPGPLCWPKVNVHGCRARQRR